MPAEKVAYTYAMANAGMDPSTNTNGRYAPGKKYGAYNAVRTNPKTGLTIDCDIRNWSRKPRLLTSPVASRTNVLGDAPTVV